MFCADVIVVSCWGWMLGADVGGELLKQLYIYILLCFAILYNALNVACVHTPTHCMSQFCYKT
jgi:hypothetical protein